MSNYPVTVIILILLIHLVKVLDRDLVIEGVHNGVLHDVLDG